MVASNYQELLQQRQQQARLQQLRQQQQIQQAQRQPTREEAERQEYARDYETAYAAAVNRNAFMLDAGNARQKQLYSQFRAFQDSLTGYKPQAPANANFSSVTGQALYVDVKGNVIQPPNASYNQPNASYERQEVLEQAKQQSNQIQYDEKYSRKNIENTNQPVRNEFGQFVANTALEARQTAGEYVGKAVEKVGYPKEGIPLRGKAYPVPQRSTATTGTSQAPQVQETEVRTPTSKGLGIFILDTAVLSGAAKAYQVFNPAKINTKFLSQTTSKEVIGGGVERTTAQTVALTERKTLFGSKQYLTKAESFVDVKEGAGLSGVANEELFTFRAGSRGTTQEIISKPAMEFKEAKQFGSLEVGQGAKKQLFGREGFVYQSLSKTKTKSGITESTNIGYGFDIGNNRVFASSVGKKLKKYKPFGKVEKSAGITADLNAEPLEISTGNTVTALKKKTPSQSNSILDMNVKQSIKSSIENKPILKPKGARAILNTKSITPTKTTTNFKADITKLKSKQLLKVTQPQAVINKKGFKVMQVEKPKELFKSGFNQKTDEGFKQNDKLGFLEKLGTGQGQKSRQLLKYKTKLQQISINKPIIKIRKPHIPIITYNSFGKEKKTFSLDTPAYDVYTRKAGKEVKLFSGLTRGEALLKGSQYVKKNIAASFGLKQRGTTGKQDTDYNIGSRFRPSKRSGWFVEKNQFRLNQPKEILQIQAARKKKGGFKWW